MAPCADTRRLTAGVLAVAVLALSGAGAAAAPAQAGTLSRTERAILDLLNAARARHGLAPLRVDADLVRASQAHSADVVRRDYFAHGAMVQRLHRYGATGTVGEVLAWGVNRRARPEVIVWYWLHSKKHRPLLLRPGFSRAGVGAAVGPFEGWERATVVTVDFEGK